jgi:hypothetical protein
LGNDVSKKLLLAFAACLLLAGDAAAKPGFFSVMQKDGRHWLADPQGRPFFCTAVNSVEMGAEPGELKPGKPEYCGLKHYPDAAAWTKANLARLDSWGFNTLGGYSDMTLFKGLPRPYTVALVMGSLLGIPWVDPGSPENLAKLAEEAARLAPRRDDPNLIGYFIDNEMGWWDESITAFWLSQGMNERPKRELLKMLKADYAGDLGRLQKDFAISPAPSSWDSLEGRLAKCALRGASRPPTVDRFLGWLAGEYYANVAAAIRKVDPNHLLLGDRYLSYYSPAVAAAAGRVMDVVSSNYNSYSEAGWASPAFFDGLYALSGKPVMVTEFYFSAMDNTTGNPNSHGPFITVATQAERAKGAAAMASIFAKLPYVVGYHWFQYFDEPKFGRGDGEDFNFGLLDIHDQPYTLLTQALGAVNFDAARLHGGARGFSVATPGFLPQARGLTQDGYLGDWNLGAAWLGRPVSGGKMPSPADFYAAWSPEGLWIALAYQNFDTNEDPAGRPRLEIGVTRLGASIPFTVSGFQESDSKMPRLIGSPRRFPELKLEGVKPLKASHALKEAVSLTLLSEIFLSSKDLGGPLSQGEAVEIYLSLKLKGPGRDWSVKLPLKLGAPW